MIELIVSDTGASFDLQKDIKLSIERNNAMFEQTSEFSLPFKIPLTSNNLRILKFPQELAAEPYTQPELDVLLNIHSFQFIGKIKVLSYTSDEIQATILFANSDMYAKIGDKELPELFSNEIFDYAPNNYTTDQKVAWWVNRLTSVMTDTAADAETENYNLRNIFAIFPILYQNGPDFTTTLSKSKFGYINQPSNTVQTTAEGVKYHTLKASQPSSYTTDDGAIISTPVGYKISPFLKLNYTLRKIFQLLGYNLENNMFDTDSDLKRICILNNTIDSIMSGRIYLSHLLPDCKVSDFLDTVRKNFGCEFVLQSDFINVKVIFYNDILNFSQTDIRDFTKILNSHLSVEYQTKKTLKLLSNDSTINYEMTSASMGNDDYFNVDTETIHMAIKEYGELIYTNDFGVLGFTFHKDVLNYEFIENNPGPIHRSFNLKRIMNFFDADDGLDAEEIKTIREHCGKLYTSLGITPIINNGRNKTTNIITSNGNKKSDEQKLDLFFAFRNGKQRPDSDGNNIKYNYMGSEYSYDSLGNDVGGLNLVWEGQTGIFEKYLKIYDCYLRKGMHRISAKLNLTPNDIINFDFYKPVIIQGVRCIPAKLQYEITGDNIKVVNAEFLMI